MAFAGLEPERLHLDWVSASEGERFSRITTEFTEAVRSLGPTHWRVQPSAWGSFKKLTAPPELIRVSKPREMALPSPEQYQDLTEAMRDSAHQLLSSGQVRCVIGYESGTHNRTRPAFIYHSKDTGRLVWNPDCTHNLAIYLRHKLQEKTETNGTDKPVAVIVKPCDSKAINVLLAEKQFSRDQVHIIGVVCDGIRETNINGSGPVEPLDEANLQSRCQDCQELSPVVYDTLIGEAPKTRAKGRPWQEEALAQMKNQTPEQRAEYWLSQFDRCILCYACRQACPMCDCPTCLYERDDSLWTGMGLGLSEKRTFHLGRAFHLAGRCVGCNECEQVCPMEIPISLLNMHLVNEVQEAFGHRAGLEATPSPFVTILGKEEVGA